MASMNLVAEKQRGQIPNSHGEFFFGRETKRTDLIPNSHNESFGRETKRTDLIPHSHKESLGRETKRTDPS